MRRTEALPGVRMISFRSVLDRHEAGELNQIEAGGLLGISERTFRRWCRRYEDDGEAGLLDRRLGRPSSKRVPSDDEGGDRAAVSDPLPRLQGAALPRAPCARSSVPLELHLDEAVAAI